MSCKHRLQNYDSALKFTARSILAKSTRDAAFIRTASASASHPSQRIHCSEKSQVETIKRRAKANFPQVSTCKYVNKSNLVSVSQLERSGRTQFSGQAEATWSDMTSPTHKSDPEDQLDQEGQDEERANKKPRVDRPPADQEKIVKISGFANVALRSVLKGEACLIISSRVTSDAMHCPKRIELKAAQYLFCFLVPSTNSSSLLLYCIHSKWKRAQGMHKRWRPG